MKLEQLLCESAPDSAETRRQTLRLRSEVIAQFQATPPEAPAVHYRRHPRRWVAGLAVAGATATAFVVLALPGGPVATPAYALERTPDGDVVVTIHELEDAGGLEAALHQHGIDAEVIFEADLLGQVPDFETLPPRDPNVIPDCGADPAPATLSREGSDWVLLIPAGSPIHDRPVSLRTTATGLLELEYTSINDPWTGCMVVS